MESAGQTQSAGIELFREFWFKRNPVHEINVDSGEDMFWATAELVAREYGQFLYGESAVKGESAGVNEALINKIAQIINAHVDTAATGELTGVIPAAYKILELLDESQREQQADNDEVINWKQRAEHFEKEFDAANKEIEYLRNGGKSSNDAGVVMSSPPTSHDNSTANLGGQQAEGEVKGTFVRKKYREWLKIKGWANVVNIYEFFEWLNKPENNLEGEVSKREQRVYLAEIIKCLPNTEGLEEVVMDVREIRDIENLAKQALASFNEAK